MDSTASRMVRAGIALGSNLGNRISNLRAARDLLRKLTPADPADIQAPIYCSCPVNCPADSPDFFNTVVEINYNGTPAQLLGQTQAIEAQLGRIPDTPPNSPRVIDLDILYLGEQITDSDNLVIPHPRMTQRRFVLQPLSDIRPSMTLPGDSVSVLDHLRSLNPDVAQLTLVEAEW
ncbi:MAG TPA: 2-amino-4-hydroxy-6-hydroxymethyldihydropteridine diphosphokinase [Verrucomicrobiales bacterium]|nr:2-amino-4-hydroxy-6-hydroxymethyldihydropteridine diphosphokinase [Verrucomicrobiales bacterium]